MEKDTQKKEGYDYNAPIEKTSLELAKVVLGKMVDELDTFVYSDGKTKEEAEALQEKGTDFGISLLSIMSTTDIPADYVSFPIDKLTTGIEQLRTAIFQSRHKVHNEVMGMSAKAKDIIFSTVLDNFDTFVCEANPGESLEVIAQKRLEVASVILAKMADEGIPEDYAMFCITKFINSLNFLKKYLDGSVRKFKDEFLSRSFGVRSPDTNTYAEDCASLGTVMLTLQDLQNKQGNNPNDYFIVTKK